VALKPQLEQRVGEDEGVVSRDRIGTVDQRL